MTCPEGWVGAGLSPAALQEIIKVLFYTGLFIHDNLLYAKYSGKQVKIDCMLNPVQ